MKKSTQILLLAICTIVCFSSCKKDDENNENPSTNNTPVVSSSFPFVKSQNSWVYDLSIDSDTTTLIVTYTIKSIDEEGYCAIEYRTSAGANTNEFVWYSNDAFFCDETGSVESYWFPLIYKSNNTIGRKWDAPVNDEDLGTITREIISVTESVTVPAGTFPNCIKLKQTYSSDPQIIDYYYLSPLVGIVKKEATGWADIDNQPRIYFPIVQVLKSKTF